MKSAKLVWVLQNPFNPEEVQIKLSEPRDSGEYFDQIEECGQGEYVRYKKCVLIELDEES